MRRLIGYTLFWAAIGMIVDLFIKSVLASIVIILILLLAGYHLFAY
ncbi:MAG: hypothetical protein LUG99_04725 [Lachnospiraceae bacterium]|nr:hypothetical protein [Lachnospiraceae bacterium]